MDLDSVYVGMLSVVVDNKKIDGFLNYTKFSAKTVGERVVTRLDDGWLDLDSGDIYKECNPLDLKESDLFIDDYNYKLVPFTKKNDKVKTFVRTKYSFNRFGSKNNW